MLLPQVILKITIWKLQIQFNISYVILRSLVGIRMSVVCSRLPVACNSHVTHRYSYVIRMLLLCARILSVCTRMPFLCHLYVLVRYLYVTCMYLYVTACHSYVLVCLLPNPKTKKYGTDTVAYKASQLWSMLPTRYKNLPSLDLFKFEIKSWHCSDCPCNICRIFVDGVGFKN